MSAYVRRRASSGRVRSLGHLVPVTGDPTTWTGLSATAACGFRPGRSWSTVEAPTWEATCERCADKAGDDPLVLVVRTVRRGHTVTTIEGSRCLAPAPAGPGRRFVLNVWTDAAGWERHEFAEDTERVRWAREGVAPGADVHWSDR